MAWYPVSAPGLDVETFGDAYGAINAAPFIQAAINNSSTSFGSHIPVYITKPLTFGTQITNPTQVPIICLAPMTYNGPDADAIVWGNGSANIFYPSNIRTSLWLIGPGISSNTHAGVKFQDVYSGLFDLRISGFQWGWEETGVNSGCAYNDIQAPYVADCVAAQYINLPSGGIICNQNTYRIHRCGADISTALRVSMTRVLVSNGQYVNGNYWENASCELLNSGTGGVSMFHGDTASSTPIIMQQNTIDLGRIENNAPTTRNIFSGAGIALNTVRGAFGWQGDTVPFNYLAATPSDFLTLANNEIVFPGEMFAAGAKTLVGSFGRENVCTSGGAIQRPARGIIRQGGAGATWLNQFAGGSLTSDHIRWVSTNHAIGMLFDVSECNFDFLRKFYIDVELTSGTDGSLVVTPFDGGGAMQLNPGDCSLGSVTANFWFSNTASLSASDNLFTVTFGGNNNIAYMFIGLTGGTNPALIQRLNVRAMAAARFKLVSDPAIYALTGAAGGSWPYIDTDDPVTLGTPDADASATGRMARALVPAHNSVPLWFFDASGVAWPTAAI